VIVLNRAVADLATTIDDIIQYKYNGNQIGSTMTSPLGPLFNNVDDKSLIYFNLSNFVFVPICTNDITMKSVDCEDNDNLKNILELKESMVLYIDSVYNDFTQMADFFMSQQNQKENDEEK